MWATIVATAYLSSGLKIDDPMIANGMEVFDWATDMTGILVMWDVKATHNQKARYVLESEKWL